MNWASYLSLFAPAKIDFTVFVRNRMREVVFIPTRQVLKDGSQFCELDKSLRILEGTRKQKVNIFGGLTSLLAEEN